MGTGLRTRQSLPGNYWYPSLVLGSSTTVVPDAIPEVVPGIGRHIAHP
jgi:hypothetical protein